ncbi:MAG: hypothetical protein NVS2B3_04130 [Vulcanimicrobiaceae bacterium]
MARVNLLVDLGDPLFAQDDVHHAIEALDREGGVYAGREHRTPERILGWIDGTFGGVWSHEAAAGGIWIAQRGGEPVGFASYDARGLRYRWLRAWTTRDGVGIFGPLGVAVAERGRGVGGVLLRAGLFSLRERGYRQALVPAVAPDLVPFFERHAGARAVENADLELRRRVRTTVLASGNGGNFAAVLAAAAAGVVPLDVTALVVNRSDAFAATRAREGGIAVREAIWNRATETRTAYDERLLATVAATEPELVLLLGWMHVLAPPFIARFPELLNVHPAFLPLDPAADRVTMPDGSSLPAYRGAHAFDDALAARSAWAGATMHRVGVAVDRGAVLARAPLPLDGAPSDLERRLHALEHRVVVDAIRRWTWERR